MIREDEDLQDYDYHLRQELLSESLLLFRGVSCEIDGTGTTVTVVGQILWNQESSILNMETVGWSCFHALNQPTSQLASQKKRQILTKLVICFLSLHNFDGWVDLAD